MSQTILHLHVHVDLIALAQDFMHNSFYQNLGQIIVFPTFNLIL